MGKLPTVLGNSLEVGDGSTIKLGTPQWSDWLNSRRSFRYEPDMGKGFTVRQEKSGYWYGYRKKRNKLHKRYIGSSHDLTDVRLNEVAWLLEQATQSQEYGDTQTRKSFKQGFVTKEEFEELKYKVLTLQEEFARNGKLHGEVTGSENEEQKLQKRITELEDSNKNLYQQVAQLEDCNQGLHKEVVKASTVDIYELSGLTKILGSEKLQNGEKKLQEQIAVLGTKNEELHKQVIELYNGKEELHKQVAELGLDNEKLQENIAKVRSEAQFSCSQPDYFKIRDRVLNKLKMGTQSSAGKAIGTFIKELKAETNRKI